eukprot:SAG22_NODE_2501_length_2507_cov_1.744911_4_plen_186_part_00
MVGVVCALVLLGAARQMWLSSSDFRSTKFHHCHDQTGTAAKPTIENVVAAAPIWMRNTLLTSIAVKALPAWRRASSLSSSARRRAAPIRPSGRWPGREPGTRRSAQKKTTRRRGRLRGGGRLLRGRLVCVRHSQLPLMRTPPLHRRLLAHQLGTTQSQLQSIRRVELSHVSQSIRRVELSHVSQS